MQVRQDEVHETQKAGPDQESEGDRQPGGQAGGLGDGQRRVEQRPH